MLSIELIRKDPEYVRQALLRRGEDTPVDKLVEMDGQRRQLIQKGDALRAQRKEASKQIAQMKERPAEMIVELRQVGEEISVLERAAAEVEATINHLLLEIPNLPRDDVPPGTGEDDNRIVRSWGEPRSFEFTPLAHWDLGEILRS